MPGNGYSATGH